MGFITSVFVSLSLNKWSGSLFSVEEECEHEQLQICCSVTPLCASQEPCAHAVSFCSLHLLIAESTHILLEVLGTEMAPYVLITKMNLGRGHFLLLCSVVAK